MPLATLLPAMLVILVIGSIAPIIAVSYFLASNTTGRLLTQRAEATLDGLEGEMAGLLKPVASQLNYARRAVAEGFVDPENAAEMRTFALGLLAATPQVYGIGLLRDDGTMRRWDRNSLSEAETTSDDEPFPMEVIDAAKRGDVAVWGRPIVSAMLGDSMLNYRVALERDGEFHGVMAAAVTGDTVSQYVAKISRDLGLTAFILSGRYELVAYPGRELPSLDGRATTLATVSASSDPVVAAIWDDPRELTAMAALPRSEGHWSMVNGRPYAYFYRSLEGFGDEPLTVAVAIPSSQSRRDRWAAGLAAAIGLLLMIAASVAAWRLGRRISKPVMQLDGALEAIETRDYANAVLPELRDAPVREWRTMGRRIELTATNLQRLSVYLPRALTHRLLAMPEHAAVPEQRIVTVMFLDLERFTEFSANQTPRHVAAHLDALFGLTGPIIENHGGVIDKYTGDGLLAFWGAPDEQPDHAERAVCAAREIEAAYGKTVALAQGAIPRMRVGLHTGPALVGDIGFPGRVNYTLTGETVNVAQRTEACTRGIQPERAVIVAATEAVFSALPAGLSAAQGSTVALESTTTLAYVCEWSDAAAAAGRVHVIP